MIITRGRKTISIRLSNDCAALSLEGDLRKKQNNFHFESLRRTTTIAKISQKSSLLPLGHKKVKHFQWEGGPGGWVTERTVMMLVQHILPHILGETEVLWNQFGSCVQPAFHGFKTKSSSIYLQGASHRSTSFKERMRFALSGNATALPNMAREERDTSLKTFKMPFFYATHMLSHYLAIPKDKTARCFRVLQSIVTPRAAGGRLRRNNTVSRLFVSRCKAAKCTEPDFPKASLPFSAQSSARWVRFGCSAQ